MRFYVPPENQGQIVEVAYAETPDGIVVRATDRHDGSVSFSVARWTKKLTRWWDSVGPWNAAPPGGRWRRLKKREAARLEDHDD